MLKKVLSDPQSPIPSSSAYEKDIYIFIYNYKLSGQWKNAV